MILAAATLTLSVTTACRGNPIGASPGPTVTTLQPSPSDDVRAAERLDVLKVAKAGSMKGYSREKFPHWRSTGENCDVRDTVLARDGRNVGGPAATWSPAPG